MAEEDISLPIGYLVDGRYQVTKKLGQGAFGAVYEIVDAAKLIIGPRALKLESIASRDQVLKVEVMVLRACQHSRHFCKLNACGRNDRFNFMVMSLVGPSLSTMRKKSWGGKFSKNTTVIITAQCLQALKDMHLVGWLHRDVKPSNFAMGAYTEQKRIVHILDFGLSRTYVDSKKKIRAPRELVGFRGTLRYCSLNAHRGKELGRSDDLISLLYMMVEMLKGGLPWKSLEGNFESGQCKEKSAAKLYEPLPRCFLMIHNYLHSLKYEDSPRYPLFEAALASVLSLELQKVTAFDWETTAPKPQPTRRSQTKGLESAVTVDNITSNFTQTATTVPQIKDRQDQARQDEVDIMSGVEELPKSRYREHFKKKG